MSLSPRSPSSTRPSSKYAGKSANAIAQSRHREKKKSYVTGLESQLGQLKAQNSNLRVELEQLKLKQLKTRNRSHRTGRGPSSASSTTSSSEAVLREREKEREINRLRALILEMGATFPPSSSSSSSLIPSTPSSSYPTNPSSASYSHGPIEAWSNSPAELALLASLPIHHHHLVSPQYWNSHPFAAPSFGGSDAPSSSTSYSSFVPSHRPPHFQLQQQHHPNLASMPLLGEGAGSPGGGGGDEGLTSRSLGLATLSEERSTAEFDASGEAASFVDFASSPESDGYRTGDSTTSDDSFNFFDPQSQSSLFSPLSSPGLDTFRFLAPWPLISLGDAANPQPSRFDSSSTPSSSSCLSAFAFSLNQ